MSRTRLWGHYGWLVDQTADHGDNERLSQRQKQAKERLDYWEDKAGLLDEGLEEIGNGIINMGTDATCDDGAQWV